MMHEKLEGNQGDLNCWRINIFVSMKVYKGIGYLFAVKRSSSTSVRTIGIIPTVFQRNVT